MKDLFIDIDGRKVSDYHNLCHQSDLWPNKSPVSHEENSISEHWVVVKGKAQVTCGEKTFQLIENQSTYISLGKVHRLENIEDAPLEIIEIQTGGYLGEDDIIRIDDDYERA